MVVGSAVYRQVGSVVEERILINCEPRVRHRRTLCPSCRRDQLVASLRREHGYRANIVTLWLLIFRRTFRALCPLETERCMTGSADQWPYNQYVIRPIVHHVIHLMWEFFFRCKEPDRTLCLSALSWSSYIMIERERSLPGLPSTGNQCLSPKCCPLISDHRISLPASGYVTCWCPDGHWLSTLSISLMF